MVDKSRSRKEGGAGIGMALCHKIIRLHGGTLMIDSRLGEGTVMKVVFPTMEREEKRPAEKKGARQRDRSRKAAEGMAE